MRNIYVCNVKSKVYGHKHIYTVRSQLLKKSVEKDLMKNTKILVSSKDDFWCQFWFCFWVFYIIVYPFHLSSIRIYFRVKKINRHHHLNLKFFG